MALTPQQQRNANLLYGLGRSRGLNDARAREFVAAAYAESSLNEKAQGPAVGSYGGKRAAGLFQLLSGGYVSRANAAGGAFDPRANAGAILPDYINYWKSHPGARPGEGAAAVERSGQGAGFYANPLKLIGALRGGSVAAGPGPVAAASVPGPTAPPPNLQPLRQAALSQLIGQVGAKKPDYSGFLGALGQYRTAQRAAPVPTPPDALKVEVQHTGKISEKAPAVVNLAKKYLGTPYVWGGEKPGGFDCSGFVHYLAARQGVNIGRTTYEQWKQGKAVARGNLQPGDVIFYRMGPRGPEHEKLYIGNGQTIEAPKTGDVVKIKKLDTGYVGARRLV